MNINLQNMKNLIILYFLIFSVNSFSQNITGRVFNKDKVPLPAATIYLDGTTISTISDENGNFALKYDPKANNILVVSFLGYENQYITGFDFTKELNIYMNVSKNALKEVIVGRKDMFTRAQKLKIFREYFIGKTSNSDKVIIQNEDDIDFKYDKQNFVLKAFSDKPLVIVNPSLGYKIEYELQTFEVAFSQLSIKSMDAVKHFYSGLSHFQEIENSAEISIRREEAFNGSQLNFFRNLASSTWSKEQFLLFKGYDKVVADKCFRISKEENYTKVEVLKRPKEGEDENFVASYDLLFENKDKSSVIFDIKSFNIYKYGNNTNIESIVFLGKIAEKRVAEMLPLNYGID